VTTVALHNLGCSKNQVDGQRMLGHLVTNGFEATDDFRTADIIIVNTCAFIQEATQEAIDAILEMTIYKREGRCRILAVAGCFSERFRDEAAKNFPEVDAWLGVTDWPDQLKKMLDIKDAPTFIRQLVPPLATQYLKIAEGCSHTCSFCAIPMIRGPFIGRTADDILAEAKWLESKGTKECIIVSQDTSYWGKNSGSSLTELLKQLLDKTEFPWIRLMYLHPQLVDDDFLRLIAAEKRILPYFDIPLQHISDDILLSMKRKPLSAGIRELMVRIRSIVPNAAIRTTFIVGYPGETARRFDDLLAFVEETRFERCGVFPFSPEQGTAAYNLKPRPRNTTAEKRCDELMALQSAISKEICASRIGQTLDVMIDSAEIDEQDKSKVTLEGRTIWDAPEVDGVVVIDNGDVSNVGKIVRVKITGAETYDLQGKLD